MFRKIQISKVTKIEVDHSKNLSDLIYESGLRFSLPIIYREFSEKLYKPQISKMCLVTNKDTFDANEFTACLAKKGLRHATVKELVSYWKYVKCDFEILYCLGTVMDFAGSRYVPYISEAYGNRLTYNFIGFGIKEPIFIGVSSPTPTYYVCVYTD